MDGAHAAGTVRGVPDAPTCRRGRQYRGFDSSFLPSLAGRQLLGNRAPLQSPLTECPSAVREGGNRIDFHPVTQWTGTETGPEESLFAKPSEHDGVPRPLEDLLQPILANLQRSMTGRLMVSSHQYAIRPAPCAITRHPFEFSGFEQDRCRKKCTNTVFDRAVQNTPLPKIFSPRRIYVDAHRCECDSSSNPLPLIGKFPRGCCPR